MAAKKDLAIIVSGDGFSIRADVGKHRESGQEFRKPVVMVEDVEAIDAGDLVSKFLGVFTKYVSEDVDGEVYEQISAEEFLAKALTTQSGLELNPSKLRKLEKAERSGVVTYAKWQTEFLQSLQSGQTETMQDLVAAKPEFAIRWCDSVAGLVSEDILSNVREFANDAS